MTAELQDCNGAVGGLGVEHEEVEVQANVKAVLIDVNLELDEENKACNGGGSENLELHEDKEVCNSYASENLKVNEDESESLKVNEDEGENLKVNEDESESLKVNEEEGENLKVNEDESESLKVNGDEGENLKVNEDVNVNLKLKEDKMVCNGDESESLRMEGDNKFCNGDQSENLKPSEISMLNEDETVCNCHVIEKLKLNEDETVCNGDGRDNSESKEGKSVCNGDLSESFESICNGDGSEVCSHGAVDDNNLSIVDQCEPELASVQAKSSDHVPELDTEDPKSSSPKIVDEVRDLECLVSENKDVEAQFLENGEGPFHSEALVDEYPKHEAHDLVNEQEEEPELQCLENEEFEVEIESANIEETKVRVDGDDEVGAQDLVNHGVKKPEQVSENEENREKKAEYQVDVVQELESQGNLEEHDSKPLPVVDMNSELVTLETQNLIREENKPELHMVNDKFELYCPALENGHDTSNHVINKVQDFERSFVINLDDFPVLQSAVDKSICLESHVVVSEENKSHLQCLPNGSNEAGSHLDETYDKRIESQCFVSGSSELMSEDINGENDENVHHRKDDICDIESGSCNESNTDGISDTLTEKSGVCNGADQPGTQEDTADRADLVIAVGPDPSNAMSILGNMQKSEVEVLKKTFFCLVKIPRHVDNKIKAQIRLAQLQLNEKTESRDFIRAAIQMKRASREQMLDRLKAARQEDRVIRDAIRSKRQEMEPVQLTLNKIRNASSVGEYDEKIYQIQYRIEHESMPLREEKQLLRDMKQLRISRDELCAIAGSDSELQEAYDNMDTIQGRSQLLGQELDSLKRQAFQAEKNTLAIEKDFEALKYALRQLQAQWSAADDIRQEAYEALRVLKKQEYERNNEFYQNKADIQEAKQHALARDRDALNKLCTNQVDQIMEMWVKNSDFRKEYMKDNERSTLRRLETLDGRSLGPDEEPPLPTNYGDALDSSQLPQGTPSSSGIRPEKEDKSSTTLKQSNVVELKPEGQQSPPKEVAVLHGNLAGKSKKPKKKSLDLFPEIESFEVSSELVKNEEDNLAKKAEEAAKMKEARRLEEMRKAKEAEERKRRLAERANAKALARAQKESERKEKERQKKANKKAAAAAMTAGTSVNNDIASSETQNDASRDLKSSPIIEEKQLTSTIQKSAASQRKKSVFQKAKPKSVFPAVAKKGRKGIQTWMWVLLAVVSCMFVLILWFYF